MPYSMKAKDIEKELKEKELFEKLKVEVIGLATALYGAHSAGTFNILYTKDWDFGGFHEPDRYIVSLIVYTSPPGTFTKWELLWKGIDSTLVEATMQLLRELHVKFENTVASKPASGSRTLTVEHKVIPDINFQKLSYF